MGETPAVGIVPLKNTEPIKMARRFLAEKFEGEGGVPGLWWFRGSFWAWYVDRWLKIDDLVLRGAIWEWLEDMYVVVGDDQGVLKRVKPTKKMIDELMSLVQVLTRAPYTTIPTWVGGTGEVPTGTVIAFQDKLVSVEGGVVREFPRGQAWFDNVVVPCAWEREAECPTWLRCLGEWGNGDPLWAALLQRWFGYCLMTKRDYARWLLKYGKIRGGKGVTDKMLQKLVGKAAFCTRSLDALVTAFGMWGLETARVLNITEANRLDRAAGETAASLVKQIIGGDDVFVNIKHQKPLSERMLAAPQMSSNEIPTLPNQGMGVSGKMLVLPFNQSFLGKEDFGLEGKLEQEVAGIAAWAVEGARQLEAEGDPQRKWPEPKEAGAAYRKFHLQNNPLDAFLEARFIKTPDRPEYAPQVAFVPSHIIAYEWNSWIRENEIKVHIPKNELLMQLEQRSTWGLRDYRIPGGHRGLKGLSVRREQEDLL